MVSSLFFYFVDNKIEKVITDKSKNKEMNILERSSMILLELCKGKEYKRAKEEYLRITHSCLDEEKSISNYFERELEERKGEIEIETYRILKENVKEIILNYKSCLEEEKCVKEVIGKEYEKEI